MRPIIFPPDETEFTSNGLGRLDCISCLVTEERNGQFELEAVVSIDDLRFSYLQEGYLLYVRHDDTTDRQPFEIYKISRPLNGKVKVYAHHISYRTAKITVAPFSAETITGALQGLKTNAVGDCPFSFWTDKEKEGTFTVSRPETLRSRLAGNEGSILDVYGTGEYEWDRFDIKLHKERGQDTGVVLRYGKNITDLTKTTDASDIWSGVYPFWEGVDPDTQEPLLITLPQKVIWSEAVGDFPYRMSIPLDLSQEWHSPPTEEQIRSRAQRYVTENAASAVPVSIDVSFIALWQTEEYKDVAALQRLRLCDSLTIEYEKLGVSNTAKIVKTVYNVLLERYDSTTIGEVRSKISRQIWN